MILEKLNDHASCSRIEHNSYQQAKAEKAKTKTQVEETPKKESNPSTGGEPKSEPKKEEK